MSCLIIGDTIAKGISGVIKGCFVIAHIGASSPAIAKAVPAWTGTRVIISAGSHDKAVPEALLLTMRRRLTVNSALWVLPLSVARAEAIKRVAKASGDAVVMFVSSNDGVLPASYEALAASIRKIGGFEELPSCAR